MNITFFIITSFFVGMALSFAIGYAIASYSLNEEKVETLLYIIIENQKRIETSIRKSKQRPHQ